MNESYQKSICEHFIHWLENRGHDGIPSPSVGGETIYLDAGIWSQRGGAELFGRYYAGHDGEFDWQEVFDDAWRNYRDFVMSEIDNMEQK